MFFDMFDNFELLTTVDLKTIFLCDEMACNVIQTYRRFRETFSFLIQGRKWKLCIFVKRQ